MLEDERPWYFCVVTSQQVNTERDAAGGSSPNASSDHRRAPQTFLTASVLVCLTSSVALFPELNPRPEIANNGVKLASLS